MATVDDVRRLALSLPETDEHPSYQGQPSFRVSKKGFAALRDNDDHLVIWVDSFDAKEALLASDSHKFFTTAHHDGYRTVLVRYAAVGVAELRELLTDAWRTKAPKRLLAAFDASSSEGASV